MNLHSANHEAAHIKETNPKGLPMDRQIRIDLDYYRNGQLLMLHIAGVLDCDMGEYRMARQTLEDVKRQKTTGPDAWEWADKIIAALRDIERWRERNGGVAYGGPQFGVKNRKWEEGR